MDTTLIIVSATAVILFGIVSSLFLKKSWWLFNVLVFFLVAAIVVTSTLPQELLPKDLPIALNANMAIGREAIVCTNGLANKYIIVEGDYLYCQQTLAINASLDRASFRTFLTINENGSVMKLKEVVSGTGTTDFSFMVPKTGEFSFELVADWLEGGKAKTLTISPADDYYSLEGWFAIRSRKEADDYISKVQTFMIATILSLASIFVAGNHARELWNNQSGKESEDEEAD